jgi:hypothetical protein
MARLIAGIGGLGVLATVGVALQGWLLSHEPAAVVRHAGLGLVAFLLALFPQTWFALYAVFQSRSLSSQVTAGAGPTPNVVRHSLRRLARVMSLAAATAIASSALAFVSGPLAYTRDVAPALHGGSTVVAIASQAVALWMALRVAGETEEVLRAIESPPG